MGPLHLGKTPIVTACVRQADHVTTAVMFSKFQPRAALQNLNAAVLVDRLLMENLILPFAHADDCTLFVATQLTAERRLCGLLLRHN
jgi:hypothetical protein